MKKIIIAAVAVTAVCAAFAADEGQGASNNWRLSVGGFARGSMKLRTEGFGSMRTEAYGADLDARYRAFQTGDFSLWAGIGGSFTPYQQLATESYCNCRTDGRTTIEQNASAKANVSAGEFRLMLVPEYALTERWSVAARVGVAFDWVRLQYSASYWGSATIGGTPLASYGPVKMSDKDTDFVTQAILGLETTYMLTDNLGLYANFDYRCGGNAKFKDGDEQVAELNMDGWYAGVGAVVTF